MIEYAQYAVAVAHPWPRVGLFRPRVSRVSGGGDPGVGGQ